MKTKILLLLLTFAACGRAQEPKAATPCPTPEAPSKLMAEATSQNSIRVEWQDNSNNETSFQIQKSEDNVNWKQASNVGANNTGYNSSGLSAGTRYYYRVRANSACGYSSFGEVVTATTEGGASPSPTPTMSATATQAPSVSPTATASATATASSTATSTPNATATATATATSTAQPTPSASASASPGLVTVTVNWIASVPTEYSIFYGKTPATDEMQVYGGRAWAAGPMSVAIANLQPNTKYYFSDTATWYEVTGPKLQPPLEYTTTAAPSQQLNLP